jgi:hypothetical protein
VQSDAERDRPRGKFVGHCLSRLQCIRRRREDEEESISLGIDLDAASRGAFLPHDAPMCVERLCVRVWAQLVQELCRPLDIGEQEGDWAVR